MYLQKNKQLKLLISLCFIFLLAVVLRFYQLDIYPTGFHIDEASLGYNAYSFLLTGRDENNHAFPLYIDMFGDNRPSGYHYLDIIPTAIFGLTVFATRFPGALFGALTVFPMFFLTQSIFKKKRLSLLVALLTALSPWHIVLSRASAEMVVSLFFIVLGFACFFWSQKSQKILYFWLGLFSLALSFFFYHTPRVFVPALLFLYIFWLYPLRLQFTKEYIRNIILGFVLISLLAVSLVFGVKGGTGRFTQVNIFGFPETKLVMEEQIREDGMQHNVPLVTRFFHNKVTNYSLTFISNYMTYFTGEFLFIKGGLPKWYIVPNMGLMYLVELPFLLIGIFVVFTKKKEGRTLIVWLLLAPVVAALTVDDVPNVNRVLVMLPPLLMLTGVGIDHSLSNIKKYRALLYGGITVLFIFNILYFIHQYFVHAPIHQNWYRNVGVEESMKDVESAYPTYDRIVITKSTGGIYPLILFYSHFSPALYQQEGSTKDASDTGFGKFFFASQECPSVNRDSHFPKVSHILYVDNGTCPINALLQNRHVTYIYRLDGTRAYRLVYE